VTVLRELDLRSISACIDRSGIETVRELSTLTGTDRDLAASETIWWQERGMPADALGFVAESCGEFDVSVVPARLRSDLADELNRSVTLPPGVRPRVLVNVDPPRRWIPLRKRARVKGTACVRVAVTSLEGHPFAGASCGFINFDFDVSVVGLASSSNFDEQVADLIADEVEDCIDDSLASLRKERDKRKDESLNG
jgi:hypothetical protein